MRFIDECLGDNARGFLHIRARELVAIRSLEGEQKRFSDTGQVWIESLRHKIAGSIITFSFPASGQE